MSVPYGGFEELIYTGSDLNTANPFGIVTRINPILDPSNINIRGTGRRGLYDILLGMRQPQFTMDILPTDIDFIADYQDGQNMPTYLHYGIGNSGAQPTDGLTFTYPRFNRVSVEARHNEAITATIEMWAKDIETIKTVASWGTHAVTPYRWLDSELYIQYPPAAAVLENYWWSWRYEINNNLQRLGNVADGDTREIPARHKDVTGLIVKDLTGFSEWTALMAPDDPKFNIWIRVNGSGNPGSGSWKNLIYQTDSNGDSRWGRLEAPVGPEDLQAKRFPFTAKDVT